MGNGSNLSVRPVSLFLGLVVVGGVEGVVEVADLLEGLMIRAVETGEVGEDWSDDALVDLLDASTVAASPVAEQLVAILEERGWKGWHRIERVPPDRIAPTGTAASAGTSHVSGSLNQAP